MFLGYWPSVLHMCMSCLTIHYYYVALQLVAVCVSGLLAFCITHVYELFNNTLLLCGSSTCSCLCFWAIGLRHVIVESLHDTIICSSCISTVTSFIPYHCMLVCGLLVLLVGLRAASCMYARLCVTCPTFIMISFAPQS